MSDLFITERLSNDEIINCFIQLYDVAPVNIAIIRDSKEWRSINSNHLIICEPLTFRGDFNQMLRLSLITESIENKYSQVDLAMNIAQFFSTEVGIPENPFSDSDISNPYIWLLVQNNGLIESVLIDSETAEDEIIILKTLRTY